MKLAYFVRPHAGGTYTVFRHLSEGLAALGIEVQWVTTEEAGSLDGERLESGVVVGGQSLSEQDHAERLIDALCRNRFDGVFVNVLANRLEMNIVRYLTVDMLRVMIVHNITPGTYAAARALRDHVHATVAVSDRCRSDLVERHGFRGETTMTVPNALDIGAFSGVARPSKPDGQFRIIYLGRIEDSAKGVFWLADILSRVPRSATLTVAGDGPDLDGLKRRLAPHADRVQFLGGVAPANVPELLSRHDVLVMPSRFEGLPLTLIEAMAAGCVPVVSKIEGVTDRIVEDGITGLLFPVGDWRGAAAALSVLESKPLLLDRLSCNARTRAADAFDRQQMVCSYSRLLERLAAERPAISPPLPIEEWSMPWGMRNGLRTMIPAPLKNWLRAVRER